MTTMIAHTTTNYRVRRSPCGWESRTGSCLSRSLDDYFESMFNERRHQGTLCCQARPDPRDDSTEANAIQRSLMFESIAALCASGTR